MFKTNIEKKVYQTNANPGKLAYGSKATDQQKSLVGSAKDEPFLPGTWAVIQVFTGKLANLLRREPLSLECIPVSSTIRFGKLHLESLNFGQDVASAPRGDRLRRLRRRLPHRRCSGHQFLPGTCGNMVSQAPKLRFRVVVSSGDIIGRSCGHHGICNLQDLGVQSQDPIYHPTCSNFEWGETNINQINQCLRVPQWLEKHLVSGGIHDGSRSLMIRSHHTGLASALIEGPRIARWYSLRHILAD